MWEIMPFVVPIPLPAPRRTVAERLGSWLSRKSTNLTVVGWLFFAAMILSAPAMAGDMTLRWTAPIQNTDGSTLTDLAGYRVKYGSSPTALTQTVQLNNAGLLAYTLTGLAPGTWYAALTAVNTQGVESALSNVVTKAISAPPPPVPQPPVIQVDARNVYSIAKRKDGFVLLVVGTAPAGTQCDPTQSVNGKYVVPRAAVTWTNPSTAPDVVVADCS